MDGMAWHVQKSCSFDRQEAIGELAVLNSLHAALNALRTVGLRAKNVSFPRLLWLWPVTGSQLRWGKKEGSKQR